VEEVLIRFRLTGAEAKALRELSASEYRHPRDQARYMLREALAERGLLEFSKQRTAGLEQAA